MNDKKAIVLLSGGLDSAIAAAFVRYLRYDLSAAVFVDRGQSNLKKESSAAKSIAEYLQIPLYKAAFSVPDLKKLFSEGDSVKFGIPARNLILGSLALPYLRALDCDLLVLGNNTEDTYPDCNKDFRETFSKTATQTLGRPVEVVAPFADWVSWDKSEEITYAVINGLSPLFALTWTCWKGGELHCGKCHACESRREGFTKAGVEDRVAYEDGYVESGLK